MKSRNCTQNIAKKGNLPKKGILSKHIFYKNNFCTEILTNNWSKQSNKNLPKQ